MFYLVDKTEDFRPESLSDSSEGWLQTGKGGAKLHKKTGSWNIKRLLLIQENEVFSTFLCMGRCKSLKSEVTQSCPTLCDPMDFSLPDSFVQGIFQARILEWVAISFSRRSSPTRD